MASRRLIDLNRDAAVLAQRFMDECQSQGIQILITCTYRSNDEQARLYAQGRTDPGKIVTNAKPGESMHNVTTGMGIPSSRAFDIVPLVDGKPVWDAEDPIWQTVGQIGKGLGLDWAGDWVHMKEYPHFQLKEGA